MVEKTLIHMKAGGIYDHLGYGFHRYSTDEQWLVPHFEKMLYDQALLLNNYTTAYQISKDIIYKDTVAEIINYIKDKMISKKGGFFSAEDADTEGEEGKFYVWTVNEINSILKKHSEEILKIYNTREKGNYYDESTGRKTGKNILHLEQNNKNQLSDLLKKEKQLHNERLTLYNEREKRIHPHKDDKILTDWNGLMIAALSRASFIFEKEEFILHRYRDGESAICGTLDDYAFYVWGLLELYQVTFKIKYLKKCINLTNYILKKFWDEANGGFFFVSKDENKLIARTKEVYDGAIQSGNSVMMCNLIRLAHITGNHKLEEKAFEMTKIFSEKVEITPTAYSHFLIGLQMLFLTYYDVIVVGDKDDNITQEVLAAIRNNYNFNISILIIPSNESSSEYNELKKYVKYINDYRQIQNKTTIYICKDYTCKLPITDPEEVKEILKI